MRKLFVVFILTMISFYMGYRSDTKVEISDTVLYNVEALAGTEITLDFCVWQPDLCTVYSDGYAIRGTLQYSVTV